MTRQRTRRADKRLPTGASQLWRAERPAVARPRTPPPRRWSQARDTLLISHEPKMARAIGQVGAIGPARCRRASLHAATSRSSQRHEWGFRRVTDADSAQTALALRLQPRSRNVKAPDREAPR